MGQWVKLQDAVYADDIFLLAENLEDIRRLTEALVEEAGKVGLKVNTNKTNIKKIMTDDAREVHIEKAAFREVDEFVYLGCKLRKGGDNRNEINIRIGKPGAALRGLSKIWNEIGISLRTMLNLFNIIVIS